MLEGSGRDPILGIRADIVRSLGSCCLGARSEHAKTDNDKKKERGTDTSDKGNTQHPTKVAFFDDVIGRSARWVGQKSKVCMQTAARAEQRRLHTGVRRIPTTDERSHATKKAGCNRLRDFERVSLGVGPGETDF